MFELPEFDDHHSVVTLNNRQTGLRGFIAFHKANSLAPSFGATRLWEYREDDAIRDALRLSRMMSYKAAMAGLRYGGAKAVIMKPSHDFQRTNLLADYTRYLNHLNGRFITGTDVGLSQEDLIQLKPHTKYLVGYSCDPAEATVLGLIHAIKSTLRHTNWSEALKGRSFAIQGLGKIGEGLLKHIYPHSPDIVVSDISSATVQRIKKLYPNVTAVSPDNILYQDVDILAPCALAHSLNSQSVSQIRARAIVGGANNQLETDEIGDQLFDAGIMYLPDYVVNAGGLLAVTDEFEHTHSDKSRLADKLLRIKRNVDDILSSSLVQQRPPHRIANEKAQKILETFSI